MNVRSRTLPLWLVVLLAWGGVCHAEDWSHICGNDFDVALGQHTVTPAQVIGTPGEQLPMHPSYPVEKKDPYLISGDHVELMTTCNAYAFVRFQGHSRVSAGWVELSRLKITGKPYVPLPRNASDLCKAAQDLLNKSDSLNGLTSVDMKRASPAEEKMLGTNENSGVIDRVRLNIGGRTIAAVASVGGKGTCDTQNISLWSSDLSTNIDAPDVDDRDPFHDTDDNAWGFGNDASLVNLLGEPMVLTRNNAGDRFYLSSIQSNGDVRPVCEGVARPAARERLTVAMDGKLCGVLAEGKGTLIELHPPLRVCRILCNRDLNYR